MRDMQVTVPLDNETTGLIARLHLQLVEAGIGAVYPDPVRVPFLRYDTWFGAAISNACLQIAIPDDVDVRWWLEPVREPDGVVPALPPYLTGPSLGAACYVGLNALLHDNVASLDAGIAVTGALDADGNVVQVGGYAAKLAAARRHNLMLLAPGSDVTSPEQERLSGAERAAYEQGKAEGILQPYTALEQVAEQAAGLVGDVLRYLDDLIAWLKTSPSYYPPEIQRSFDFTALDQSVRVSSQRLPWRKEQEARAREAAHRGGETDDELVMRRVYSHRDEERYTEILSEAVVRHWEQVRETPMAVLLGDPGYGKSWRLKAEALELAAEQQEKVAAGGLRLDEVALPVFVRLPALATTLAETNSLVEAVVAVVRKTPNRFTKLSDRFWDWMTQRLRATLDTAPEGQSPGLVLLLDGLDEVHENVELVREHLKTLDVHPSRRVILASRIVGYDEGGGWPFAPSANSGDREFELLTLRTEQIVAFIGEWFRNDPERGRYVQEQVTNDGVDAIKGLARIPLMLSFICLVGTGSNDDLPTRRVDLYEAVLHRLLQGQWREGSERRADDEDWREAKIEVLAEVAFRLAKSERGWTDLFRGRDLGKATRKANAARTAQDLRPHDVSGSLLLEFKRDGVFVPAGTASPGQEHTVPYLWAHRSLAEYLVARYLAAQPQEDWMPVVEQHRWFDADWVEPISLLGGKLDDPQLLLKLLLNEPYDIFHNQLMLAARVAAEVDSDNLSELTDDVLVQRLTQLLGLKFYDEPSMAIDALARIGSRRARVSLRQEVIEPSDYFSPKSEVINALGRMGDREGLRYLLSTLDPWNTLRVAVLMNLATLGERESIPQLRQIIDPSGTGNVLVGDPMAWEAAIALQILNAPLSAETVRALVTHQMSYWGRGELTVAEAEVRVGELSLEFVRLIANDDDPEFPELRRVAIMSLMQRYDREGLRNVLFNPALDPHSRRVTVPVLAELGEYEALREIAFDPNVTQQLRGPSMVLLGWMGDYRCIPMLRHLHANPDTGEDLRWATLSSLALMGDPDSLQIMRKNLVASEQTKRKSAANVLSWRVCRAPDLETLRLLLPVVIDPDYDNTTRDNAIQAVVKHEVQESWPALLTLIENAEAETELRVKAVEALAQLQVRDVLPTFRTMLQDVDVECSVRQSIARAIAEFRDSETIPLLRKVFFEATNSFPLKDDQEFHRFWIDLAELLIELGDRAALYIGFKDGVLFTIYESSVVDALARTATVDSAGATACELLSIATLSSQSELIRSDCYDSLRRVMPLLRQACTDEEWVDWRKELMPLTEAMLEQCS